MIELNRGQLYRIFELWIDGANPTGYVWPAWFSSFAWGDICDQEFWEASSFAPNTKPKPTWNELLHWHGRVEYGGKIREANWAAERHALSHELSPVSQEEGPALSGHRHDRITAIQHLVLEHESTPGDWTPVRLKAADGGGFVDLQTPQAARKYVGTIAARHNRAQNLRHTIRQELDALLVATLADGATQADRDAFEAAVTEEAIAARFAALTDSPDLSEPDLDAARQQARNNLDSLAAAKRRWILDVETNQGAALPPSCTEQETALRELAAAVQKAKMDIADADTVPSVEVARDAGAVAIAAVQVEGTPVWTGAPTEVVVLDRTQTPPEVLLTARAVSPTTTSGPVSYSAPQPWRVFIKDDDVALAYGGSSTLRDRTLVAITARNSCGPSIITVLIKERD